MLQLWQDYILSGFSLPGFLTYIQECYMKWAPARILVYKPTDTKESTHWYPSLTLRWGLNFRYLLKICTCHINGLDSSEYNISTNCLLYREVWQPDHIFCHCPQGIKNWHLESGGQTHKHMFGVVPSSSSFIPISPRPESDPWVL